MSIGSVMPSNHLILYCPLFLLPSIFPSIRVFSKESALHIRWPSYCSFSFSISPSNEYSGLISFRMDWLDLLAVQGTLKSLLQNINSKASILWRSAFFMVQLSHPYMTTGKIIALPRQTFVCQKMSLLFNMLRTQLDSEAGGEPLKGEDSCWHPQSLEQGLSSSAGHHVGSTKGFLSLWSSQNSCQVLHSPILSRDKMCSNLALCPRSMVLIPRS